MTKIQKETIKKFFQAIDKVLHSPGNLCDLGLIISDKIKINDLIDLTPYPERVEVFNLSEKNGSDEFVNKLVECFKNKKWSLVELKDGYLPSIIYNQLRILSAQNRLQVPDLAGKQEVIDLKMPEESRIVFLINQESLSKINNTDFIKLFGPVIKI